MSDKIKYPFLYAWDCQMGSLSYWIDAQQDLAKQRNAPKTVIYFAGMEERWISYEDISTYSGKKNLWNAVKRLQDTGRLEADFVLPPEPKLSDFPRTITVKIEIQQGGESLLEIRKELQDGITIPEAAQMLICQYNAELTKILSPEDPNA